MVLSHNTRGCRESATPEIERWIYRARKLTGKSAGLPGACRCDTRHEGPASAPIHTYSTPMTSDLTFAPPSPEDMRAGTLGRELRQFNYRFVNEYPESRPMRLDARDAQGRLRKDDWWPGYAHMGF